VIVIKNVPTSLLGAELPEGASIISDTDSKREAFMARKAELEEALEEINYQIAALECEEHGHQIVASDADPENGTEQLHCERCGFTDTYLDKADYALHCMHKSLGSLSPALGRISRLCGLLRVSEKDGKNKLPDIITHNESRIALRHLTMVKCDVDEASQEILSIFENTKEPGNCPQSGNREVEV
jgi:hypothetical protein